MGLCFQFGTHRPTDEAERLTGITYDKKINQAVHVWKGRPVRPSNQCNQLSYLKRDQSYIIILVWWQTFPSVD